MSRIVRGIACAWCALVMVVTLTGSPAHGEDLAQAKRRAESAISQAQSEVASATTALDAAQAKVREAEAKVEYAQHVLAEATQAWEQAQEVEAQKAIELYEAEQALALAQAKVNAGQAKIDAQTEQINAYARSVVQDSSPLMSVAILLSSGSTAELANRVQWVDTVLFTNQVDLDDLREVLTSLTAARAECEEARIAADLARQEAAAQVEASAAVREEALRAEAEMASALSESQAAKNYAAQVLANRQTSLSQARSDLAAINARIAAEQRAEQARQQAAAAQNSSGSSGSQGSGGGANGQLTPAQAQSAAYGMMASYGWQNQTQFQCLVSLWNRESGWRWSAENPSSGAYGIPQSLPASKMASAGADYRTNAVTQISWGLRYIKSRYGTPCGAWSFWQKNHWY